MYMQPMYINYTLNHAAMHLKDKNQYTYQASIALVALCS